MFSIKSYYQVLDLQVSNACLIDLYTQILRKHQLEDYNTQKVIAEKLEIRKEIERELNSCLEKNFLSKRARLISTFFPFLMETKYKAQKYSRINKRELILDLEVQNIRNYYKILFDQKHPRSVTDLLLDQKRRVETCVIHTRS